MSHRFTTQSLLPCILLTALMVFVAITLGREPLSAAPAQAPANQAPTQWEFAALKLAIDTPANEVSRAIMKTGREGWELVSVENFAKDGTTTHTSYYFKRPL